MTTKFNVTIYGNGHNSKALLDIIGTHNEGKVKVTINDICGFISCLNALYPVLSNTVVKEEAGQTIHISNVNQKEPYLTITECTYEELKTEEVNQSAEILN